MTCPRCGSERNYRDGCPRDQETLRSLDQPVYYCFDCNHCWDDNGQWVTEEWDAKAAAIEAECKGNGLNRGVSWRTDFAHSDKLPVTAGGIVLHGHVGP